MLRILIIEDDPHTSHYLLKAFQEAGYIVDIADNGLTGRDMALEDIYDALIIDRLLPQLDGIALVQQLRAKGLNLPILMLSALDSAQHKAQGLAIGCDDYLAKPYAFVEISARLEGLLARYHQQNSSNLLQVADLIIDTKNRTVNRAGITISLPHREYLLLEKLMLNAEQVVTRSMLLESAWNYDFDPKDNIIDKHIYKLRQKIDQPFAQPLIHTVAGAGYIISSHYPV